MNEMIDEIKSLLQSQPNSKSLIWPVLVLDVLGTMAQRIEQLENQLADKGAQNVGKKESGFNIG